MARQYRDSYLSFKKAFFCHLVNGWHSLKYKYTLIAQKYDKVIFKRAQAQNTLEYY